MATPRSRGERRISWGGEVPQGSSAKQQALQGTCGLPIFNGRKSKRRREGQGSGRWAVAQGRADLFLDGEHTVAGLLCKAELYAHGLELGRQHGLLLAELRAQKELW